jgi:hypothetical protein
MKLTAALVAFGALLAFVHYVLRFNLFWSVAVMVVNAGAAIALLAFSANLPAYRPAKVGASA